MSDSDEPRTTTILTIDLPPELGLRLRRAARRRQKGSLTEIAIEALEAWLDRDEAEDPA